MGTPRVTNSTAELITLGPGIPRVTNSTVEFIIGGPLPPVPTPISSSPPAGSTGRFRCCVEGHCFQAARQAEILRYQQLRREAWPYVHLLPPADSEEVQQDNIIPVPAPGLITPVVSYQVPTGSRFYLVGILQAVAAGAFNPGDVIWTVDLNASTPNVQGMPVNGLVGVPFTLGSLFPWRWWPFMRPYEFAELSLVRSTAVNVNLVGGFLASALMGYLVPTRPGADPAQA